METKKSNNKAFWAVAAMSLALFLCTCWFSAMSFYVTAWVQSVTFFGLAWLCAYKLNEKGKSLWLIGFAIILGRIIVEIPIRVSDFRGSYISLATTLICLASIVLALVCYHERRTSVYVLSTILLVIANTFIHERWCEYVKHMLS